MKLYSYWRSSCSWRVRIALQLKDIAHEIVPVHLVRDGGEQHAAGYRRKNPMAQVPLLQLADGRELSQSMAILEFLEDQYPEPALLPADPFARGKARQLAELINSGIQPLQNLRVMQHVKSLGQDDKAWSRHWINAGLEALEAIVPETAGAFCVGDAPGIADLMLVPQLYNARRFELDLDQFPTLVGIEKNCEALDAFARAHPDRQVDAPK